MTRRKLTARKVAAVAGDEKTVLDALRKYEGAVSSGNLERFTGLSEGRLAKALNDLVKRGLVLERPSPRGVMFPNYEAATPRRGKVTRTTKRRVTSRKVTANPTVLGILEASSSPVAVDSIVAQSRKPTGEVMAELTMLEISGQARSVGDRWAATAKPSTKTTTKPTTRTGGKTMPGRKSTVKRGEGFSRAKTVKSTPGVGSLDEKTAKPVQDASRTVSRGKKSSLDASTSKTRVQSHTRTVARGENVVGKGNLKPARVRDGARTTKPRKNTAPKRTGIVQVEICSTHFRDLATGRFHKKPESRHKVTVLQPGQVAARATRRAATSGDLNEMEFVDGLEVRYSYNPRATSLKNLNLRVQSIETPAEFRDGLTNPATREEARKAWAYVQGAIRKTLRERLVAEITGKAITSSVASEQAKRAAKTRAARRALLDAGLKPTANSVTRDEAAREVQNLELVIKRERLKLQNTRGRRTEASLKKRITRLNAWLLHFQRVQRGQASRLPKGWPRAGVR